MESEQKSLKQLIEDRSAVDESILTVDVSGSGLDIEGIKKVELLQDGEVFTFISEDGGVCLI